MKQSTFEGTAAGSQQIPNNVETAVLFDATPLRDPRGMRDATDKSKIIIGQHEGGVYDVHAFVAWPAAGGYCSIFFRVNGDTTHYLWQDVPAATGATRYATAHGQIELQDGDVLQVFAYQNSGAALNTVHTQYNVSRLALTKMLT